MGHKTQRIQELEEQVVILMEQLRKKCAEIYDLKQQIRENGDEQRITTMGGRGD